MGSRLTAAENTLNNVKTTAETAETKADDALTQADSNTTNINTLRTDVNALKAVDTSLGTRIDNVDSKASAAKIKAEEGVAKADNALTATRTNATNINALKTAVAINRTTLGTQCKNLLKNTAATTTLNGVTFTVNNDKSITVSGTATNSIIFLVGTAYISQTGDYTYTGTPSGGASATYSMNYRNSNAYKTTETGNGITAQFEGGKTYEAVIDIRSGVTISNLTFYPMLRYADITDDTYEPYSDNVDTRLTENKSDIAVNKTTLGTQCKNLLKNTAVTTTINGVTFTVNDDKSITVNGTATSAGVYAVIGGADVIAGNRYIISGGAGNGGTYGLYTENFGTVQNYGSDSIYVPNTTGKAVFRIFVRPGVTVSNVIFYPMLRYADITDSTYEPYKESVDERLTENKSNTVINKSTLGYQCKNLHDTLSVNWYQPDKTSVASNGTVTATMTSDTRNFTYANSEHYITLEAGNYIITVNTLEFVSGSAALIRGCNSDNQSLFALPLSSAGLHKATFSLSKKTTIGIMYKLYSQTCTIMIRDADILDGTYEPYQPSVQEQTPYSISVSGKSTSAAISYSGVPTLICLTPNTADSTTGGLYMINSAGAVVKLIAETGIVVAANTANNTFTITNNTTTVMDVCISRCWGR